MFTGIIHQMGAVIALERKEGAAALLIDPRGWPHHPDEGESIAIDGCCLTLASAESAGPLRFDVIPETLRRTTLGSLRPGDLVNLERSATPSTLLSGHIVQGHIDGVGTARRIEMESRGDVRIRIEPPDELMDYIVPRGSIALDGVSLTVAAVGEDWFEVALIPTTLEWTNLSRIGSDTVRVNLEADCLVKAVVHYLRRRGERE